MCCSCKKDTKVYSVHTVNGKIQPDEPSLNQYSEIPEHVDNGLLNRNVHKGILGFRYETKDTSFVVYTSVEAKTFCYIMQLKPLK